MNREAGQEAARFRASQAPGPNHAALGAVLVVQPDGGSLGIGLGPQDPPGSGCQQEQARGAASAARMFWGLAPSSTLVVGSASDEAGASAGPKQHWRFWQSGRREVPLPAGLDEAPWKVQREACDEGRTLADLVAGGWQAQPHEAAAIAAQLLAVLDYLGGVQPAVLLGNVRPENVFLDEGLWQASGRVLVLDPGCEQVPAAAPGLSSSFSVALPQCDSFTAPELQSSSRPPSPAADLFGLGATLVYILTGQPPATCPMEVPLPDSTPGQLGAQLSAVLYGLLEPLPADRMSAADALAVLRGTQPPSCPSEAVHGLDSVRGADVLATRQGSRLEVCFSPSSKFDAYFAYVGCGVFLMVLAMLRWWLVFSEAGTALLLMTSAAAVVACALFRVHWSLVCFAYGFILLCATEYVGEVSDTLSSWPSQTPLGRLLICSYFLGITAALLYVLNVAYGILRLSTTRTRLSICLHMWRVQRQTDWQHILQAEWREEKATTHSETGCSWHVDAFSDDSDSSSLHYIALTSEQRMVRLNKRASGMRQCDWLVGIINSHLEDNRRRRQELGWQPALGQAKP